MILAALKFINEAIALVLDFARRVLAWIRDPARDWWKVGCLTFSALFAVAAVYANDQRGDVADVTTELVALRAADADLAQQLEASKLWATLLEAQLAKEIGLRQDVERLNKDAVAKVQAKAAQAARAAADWKRRYTDRPDTCKAAQAALEDACGTLSGY